MACGSPPASAAALGTVAALLFIQSLRVTAEALCQWCRTCGPPCANPRCRRPRPGDTWPLDAVFLTIHSERHDRWRAGDQDGHVLNMRGQRRRNTHAATQVFRKLLTGLTYVPQVILTDTLPSDGAAKRAILPGVEQLQYRSLHNRAEPSHQPPRQWERRMQGGK